MYTLSPKTLKYICLRAEIDTTIKMDTTNPHSSKASYDQVKIPNRMVYKIMRQKIYQAIRYISFLTFSDLAIYSPIRLGAVTFWES